MNEKRKHPRLKKLLFTAAKRYDENGEIEEGRIGMTVDISVGGMLVVTEKPLPYEASLELFLGFGDSIIKIKGQVTRLEKQGANKTLMGIKFLELDEESKIIIQAATISSGIAKETAMQEDKEEPE